MRKITFISNQDNQTFAGNSPLQFSLLSPQQTKPSTVYFNQIIFETCKDTLSLKARLFVVSCSLVNKSTIFNANYCDIFKIVCLIPLNSQEDCSKYLIAFNTDRVNGLTLPSAVDKISFQISDRLLHSLTPSLSQNPTVVDMNQELTAPLFHQNDTAYKIILNSNDRKSQNTYKGNSGVDFTINLPQEISLKENESWTMELSSIFIHKYVFYEFPQNFLTKNIYFWFIGLKKIPDHNEPIENKHIQRISDNINIETSEVKTFTNGYQLINEINAAIKKYSGVEESKFSLMKYGKVQWIAKTPSKLPPALKDKYIDVFLVFKENTLGKILGFTHENQISKEDKRLGFSLWRQQPRYNNATSMLDKLIKIQSNLTVGKHLPFRWLNTIDSKPILVTCDLLKSSILGKNYIKSLKLIHTHDKFIDPYIVGSNFEPSTPVELETKTFNSIKIQLCDIYGQVLPRSINDKFDKNIQTIVEIVIKRS